MRLADRDGDWESIFSDLETDTWNARVGSGGHCTGGIELIYDGTHLGVVFPDNRFRVPCAHEGSSGMVFLDSEDAEFRKGDTWYIVGLYSDGLANPHFDVYKRLDDPFEDVSSCDEHGPGVCRDYEYCPYCGEDLP